MSKKDRNTKNEGLTFETDEAVLSQEVEKTVPAETPKAEEARTLRVLKGSFSGTLGKHVVEGAVHDYLKGNKLIEIGEDARGQPKFEVDGLDSVKMTPSEFTRIVDAWKTRPAY